MKILFRITGLISKTTIDLLPRLQPWDSPKESSRLRVSSALKYAFAWGVQQLPSGYNPRRAFQRVQPGQTGLSTRTRRVLRQSEYQFGPPQSGIQPTGYRHSRPFRRDVTEWFSGFLTRWAVDAKRPSGSKTRDTTREHRHATVREGRS